MYLGRQLCRMDVIARSLLATSLEVTAGAMPLFFLGLVLVFVILFVFAVLLILALFLVFTFLLVLELAPAFVLVFAFVLRLCPGTCKDTENESSRKVHASTSLLFFRSLLLSLLDPRGSHEQNSQRPPQGA